jgi:hypothetical protein
MPRLSCGRAATAALNSSAATAARFGSENELESDGMGAACRNFGREPNAGPNYGAECVARCGAVWASTKRARSSLVSTVYQLLINISQSTNRQFQACANIYSTVSVLILLTRDAVLQRRRGAEPEQARTAQAAGVQAASSPGARRSCSRAARQPARTGMAGHTGQVRAAATGSGASPDS